MIGLSLSKCVAAIYRGEVKLEDVKKIISRTSCREGRDEWNMYIHECKLTHWKDFPEKAEKIARDFLEKGLIEQPRLSPARRYPDISGGIWVKSEKDIKWLEE